MRTYKEDEVIQLIERMCQIKYNTHNDGGIKKKFFIEFITNNILVAQLEVLTKQLDGATIFPTNDSQVQMLCCDFYGEHHANGNCVSEGYVEEMHYVINLSRGNPYSNAYNAG